MYAGMPCIEVGWSAKVGTSPSTTSSISVPSAATEPRKGRRGFRRRVTCDGMWDCLGRFGTKGDYTEGMGFGAKSRNVDVTSLLT